MLSTLTRASARTVRSRLSSPLCAPALRAPRSWLHLSSRRCAAASSTSQSPSSSGASAAPTVEHQPATTRPSAEECLADHPAPPASPSFPVAPAAACPRPAVGSDHHFELVVIGSGPSGQKCAIDAAKKGKRVCVVDKVNMFGGVCIHTGTIPSKTFREAILHVTAHNQRGFGGEIVSRSPTLSKEVLDRVKKVEQWETDTILRQLHRNRVTTVGGTARFVDAHHIEVITEQEGVDAGYNLQGHMKLGAQNAGPGVPLGACTTTDGKQSHIIRGDKFLIATGSRPARNPNYPWDSPIVFDSDAILKTPTWGEITNLVVVGAGVIAMEYASMFSTLPDCKVTIIDERTSFLDFIDSEVIDTFKYVMRRKGTTFLLGEKVKDVRVQNNGTQVRVSLDSGKTVVGDALFYAVGRQAESSGLGLEHAGVETARRGLIPVNEYFQTSQPHIYAAGDIIGFPALASTAMEQGRLCSQHMFGAARPMKPVFPYGIYTIPEISVVGHSEQELTKLRIPYKTGMALYEETAKGQMMGGPHIDGFLKLLFCPTTHRLLGASAIGENATEIIHIGQSVMSLNGTIEYFRDSVFNYPTYAELFRIAALDGINKMQAAAEVEPDDDSGDAQGTPTV